MPVPTVDLFAVQPRVSGGTYGSEARFEAVMRACIERCLERRPPGPPVPGLAVFPEQVATYLALTPLGRLGTRLRDVRLATALAVLVRPARMAAALSRVGLRAPEIAALLALGPEIRHTWETVFGRLARESGLSIVAGSALLPDGGDEVFNLSLTFAPNGHVVGSTRKVNLVPGLEDSLGLSRGRADELMPVTLPVGPVGTLICYDGFAVPHTRSEPRWCAVGPTLAARGARIIAQPAANPWPWDGPWVHRPRADATLRREQWQSEGLEAQLSWMVGVRYGVTAHLVGRVLDQRFDGRSAIVERGPDGAVTTLAAARSANEEDVVHARVEAPWLD